MKERPILFSGEMVRAILEGRKTQTRRIIKDPICTNKEIYADAGLTWYGEFGLRKPCKFGAVGDRLWVKETFCKLRDTETREDKTFYRATDDIRDIDIVDGDGFTDERKDGTPRSPWKPSLFMPRALSRITLEIVSVRVERLQDITEADAKAEGIGDEWSDFGPGAKGEESPVVSCYASLWQSINGAGSWRDNPWVWVVEFKKIEVTK